MYIYTRMYICMYTCIYICLFIDLSIRIKMWIELSYAAPRQTPLIKNRHEFYSSKTLLTHKVRDIFHEWVVCEIKNVSHGPTTMQFMSKNTTELYCMHTCYKCSTNICNCASVSMHTCDMTRTCHICSTYEYVFMCNNTTESHWMHTRYVYVAQKFSFVHLYVCIRVTWYIRATYVARMNMYSCAIIRWNSILHM